MQEKILKKTARLCRERGIRIPTFAELKDPSLAPANTVTKLKTTAMSEVKPQNLYRITWKNNTKTGLFGGVNSLEIPRSLSSVKAKIVGLIGRHFPTGAHKVGAAFGCLAPRLVTGEFDPTKQKAVWPSTGNYCRGGAFDSALLGCTAVAILPEGMSRERFDWLKSIGAEIIKTPGTESNVKEIYDKCWEIKKSRPDCVIFNQFEEFGNPIWHYHCTGSAIEEAFDQFKTKGLRLSAYVSATGSAGTIAAGDYLRTKFPLLKVAALEALQCPTLFANGFGEHRIEGIGDKHVPWVHNVRNTDVVAAINDESCMRILRLFNEPVGQKALEAEGIPGSTVRQLSLLGISSIANLLGAIKLAKYFEFDNTDVVFTVFTDSVEMYRSRLAELRQERGPYRQQDALVDLERYLRGVGIDYLRELTYHDKKALHNLKYFTWVEQQGKTSDELRRLWDPDFWQETFSLAHQWDRLIKQFNDSL